MAPNTPEKRPAQESVPPALDGESIVISGISGLYPQSHHVQEFSEILYNKVNPVTAGKPRWKYTHPEVPAHTGVVPGLDRFDAQFFKVHYRQATCMDPMSRKLLEQAYQAIFDAGLSAEHLSGRKVGVYVGCCFSESEKASFYDPTSRTGFGISGCSKTMFANRISYWLNAKGPSMAIDEACCSSLAALEQACQDMRLGECEAAIVGGSSICLHPQYSVHFGRIFPLCKDGKTKSFDQNCDGVVRSESINVLFLQKAKSALRIYAHVLHVKNEFTSITNGENGSKFNFVRDPKETADFIQKFYDEVGVVPEAVEYVEAFGSAVPEADRSELEAIGEVYCKDRSDTLLVGSVMSNIGYSEAASGICAITKVLLAYQNGTLAANLHCSSPRTDVPALADGRMRIVTDHQPFRRSYAAVNSLSYTGVNAHVLLHGHYKPKNITKYKSNIPHLVTISGRHETAVKNIIDDLKNRPIDPEELTLFHNIYELSQPGHMSRGFTILSSDSENKTVSLVEKVDYFDDAKRPLWFVYSGMGSQWAGMGAHLMRIPIFAAAIERCHTALAPKGIDIVHIITSHDKSIFDNILHSFVGIAAVQIGLTDVLREIGIVPDRIIGHSVGELGCAYADGCFTAEEMILSAYSRGLVSIQTPFIRGSMAAVGIGYQEISKLCPPEIQVACHNGTESSTISGPAEVMREFVEKLTAQGTFAKEVPCSNIAYHSRYIAEAGPKLLEYLSEVIKSPKRRSERWLSTSVPQERWGEENAQYCSAWYHTNNLLSPVLFEETSRLVPAGAVLVEIAPHGLLQAILKRSLHPDCRNIALTKRGHPDNALSLLEGIGKIYMEGYNPKVKTLYPKVEFPVSTGTPMMSHLVEWSHSEKWMLPLFVSADRKSSSVCNFVISIHEDEHTYLKGNVVRGKIQYPFAAALVAVWDTYAMSRGVRKKELSVQFRDVHLFSQPMLHDGQQLEFNVSYHWGTGRFEVMNGQSKVASGFIDAEFNQDELGDDLELTQHFDVDSEEVYEYLKERSYSFSGDFRSICRSNSSFTNAQIFWNANWVTLIDGLLQLNILRRSHDSTSQPSHINKIIIDVQAHKNTKAEQIDGKNSVLNAVLSPIHGFTRCGGILLNKIELYDLPPQGTDTLFLKNHTFVAHFQSNCKNLVEIFQIYLQIVAENVTNDVIKIVEISKNNGDSILNDIITIVRDIPGSKFSFMQVDKFDIGNGEHVLEADVVLATNLSVDKKLFETMQRELRPGTLVINGEQIGVKRGISSECYRPVCANSVGRALLELARWKPVKKQFFDESFIVNSENDFPELIAKCGSLENNRKLLVLGSYPEVEGLKDLIKKLRKGYNRCPVSLALITSSEQIEHLPWISFDLDLAFNVYKNGIWGGEYFVSWQENVAVERGMTLQSGRVGDLDSLHWVEVPEPKGPGILVTVRYAGINDIDAKRATGVIPFTGDLEEQGYGMDFSGTTDNGEHVMGVVRGGAASGLVRAQPEMLWPVPTHWSLEDAATVPLAYCQAFYCLGIKAQLCPGMAVLVHGGAGALGQAAISIALALDCQVFATVSSTRKKHFLRKLFPQLKENHIGNSRDNSFGYMVLQATRGRGCDIIISCVQGGLKNTTLNCASYCGITFDTVQAHLEDDYSYGMYYMTKQRSYMVLDFNNVFDSQEEMKMLQEMMSEGIARGHVKPLSRVTYAAQESTRAFRLLADSRHRGRVLLRLRDSIIAAKPRITCSPDLSHLVFCDSQGLGLQLAGRLIKRGAKKLHLHFSPDFQHNLQFKLGIWKNLSLEVKISVSPWSPTNVINVLNEAFNMAPLEGVYVVSMEPLDEKDLSNLDLATRKLCPSLKYFALLVANSPAARILSLKRAQSNLPATTVHLPQWSAVSGSWSGILEAVERALHCRQPTMQVQPLREARQTLLQQIAAIADIKVFKNVEESLPLKYIGFDNTKASKICAFLLNTYNVSLEEEEIPLLTVKKIKELEERLTEPDFKDLSGLETFVSYVDSDELLANSPLVFLPTLVKNIKLRDDEIDVNKTYLCIMPGVEGHHARFRALCQQLKVPALVLQPGVDFPRETLHDMAIRYTQTLQNKIQLKDNFYLLGYEGGVKLALKVAENLENKGLTGTVYCVGGIPEELEAVIKDKLQGFSTEEALQDGIIRHMFKLMLEGTPLDLDTALKGTSSWQDKLNAVVNTLLGRVSHSKQYTRSIIETTYSRIEQFRSEKFEARRLKSRVVVLRAASVCGTPAHALQRYSQQPVLTYSLRAPLAHAAKDPRCAAIVNRHLSEDILQEFEDLNICDSYLINADVFICKISYDEDNDVN